MKYILFVLFKAIMSLVLALCVFVLRRYFIDMYTERKEKDNERYQNGQYNRYYGIEIFRTNLWAWVSIIVLIGYSIKYFKEFLSLI